MTFQALAIVMAPAASAAVNCCSRAVCYGTINVGVNEAVEDRSGLDERHLSKVPPGNFGAFVDCAPVAPISTTTAININGNTGEEFVGIEMWDLITDNLVNWGAVNWTINLGS